MSQPVFNHFGGVLTSTLPITLTGSLPDLPDAATGLVHLGGGRYYDPAIGRPLQPNTAGNNAFNWIPSGASFSYGLATRLAGG